MRILHTVEFYYPHVGGAEEVVRQLSERLAMRGHEVTVATSFDPRREDSIINGVQVVGFKIKGNIVKGIRGEKRKYIDFIKSNDWDVVLNYAAQSWPTDLVLPILAKIQGRKVLAPCGYSGLLGLRRLLYHRYFTKLPSYLRLYDMIVYHSAYYIDKEFGDRVGVKHYRIIPNGVDVGDFKDSNFDFHSKYGINTPYMILSVGNHYRLKGHSRILEAFRNLRRTDVTLVLIGNKPHTSLRSCWSRCRRAAAKDKRIVLLQDVPRSHVIAAFKAADLFLFGSYLEAFPLVILEAMASSTPFVTFEVGALRKSNPQFIGGIIVESINEMTTVMDQLIDNTAIRQKLGLDGYKCALQSYNWEKIVDRYESLYKQLAIGCS